MKKGILAALALSLALPACALGEAGYTAGTYSAEAQGMESAVKVTVTVSDSAITDLTIDVSGETAGLGTEVGEPLKAAILEAQSADVDGVASATVSSTAVKTAVKACLDEASGAAAWQHGIAHHAQRAARYTLPHPGHLPYESAAAALIHGANPYDSRAISSSHTLSVSCGPATRMAIVPAIAAG